MKKEPTFKIGEWVLTRLLHTANKKVVLRGKVKAIIPQFGRATYIITGAVAEDFPSRSLKKIK